MKTVKFRLINEDEYYIIQIKRLFTWRTLSKEIPGISAAQGSNKVDIRFSNKKDAFAALPQFFNLRPELIKFIQYPTLKVFWYKTNKITIKTK